MKNIPVYKDIYSDEKPVISKPLLEFNKFYKELNDLYHETALNAGLSESSFDILYSVFELGDGCLQSDIQKISFFAKADYQFFDTQTRKRGIYIFFRWKRPLKAHKSDTDRQTTYTGKDISNSKVRKQFLFFIKQRRTETFT